MKKLGLILLFCASSLLINAQDYTTLTYCKHDTLKLDLFQPKTIGNGDVPLVIYVHGGGFASGDRTSGYPFCQYLAQKGYAAATISYTLYMKGKDFGCEGITSEKIRAMQYGAGDLWQATSFFIQNHQKYHIDTTKIFIAGNSAGAETSLHAAFWNYSLMNMFEKNLPDGFRYAGLVAGAGAIMDLNLITEKTMIPVMMFHGDSDRLVPYGTAAHHFCKTDAAGWLMLFGSHSIYKHMLELGGTVYLVTYPGRGHEYNDKLFNDDPQTVVDFLNRVLKGEHFQCHTIMPLAKKQEQTQHLVQ